MNLKEKILKDYTDADESGQMLLVSAISEILPFLNYPLDKLYDSIDELIDRKGKMVIKLSRKKRKVECEKETYKMVLLNEYLNSFKYKKPRKIHLNHNPKEQTLPIWDYKNESEPKIINGNRLFLGIF